MEDQLKRVDELNDCLTESSSGVDKMTQSVETLAHQQATIHSTMLSLMSVLQDRGVPLDGEATPMPNPDKRQVQINASTSEPGFTILQVDLNDLSRLMPNRNSMMKKLNMPVFD